MFKFTRKYSQDLTVRNRKVFQRQGPGGRSSNSGLTATVFGATGMVGRNLVNNLGKQGTTVVTPYRGTDDDRRFLKVMGDLGKIVQLRFDLRDEQQIYECVKHSDIVYNCIGRNYPTKYQFLIETFRLTRFIMKEQELWQKLPRKQGYKSLFTYRVWEQMLIPRVSF